MFKECDSLCKSKCRRNTFIMYGLSVAMVVSMLTLGLLMLSSVTSSELMDRENNSRKFQISLDEADDKYLISTHAPFNHRMDQVSGTSNNVDNDPLNLDDEDYINLKVRLNKTPLDNRNRTKRLPQAIIIGVKKAGTRALLEYLRLHPSVRAPGPEPHFFDKYYHKGLKWYRNLMPDTTKHQLTVEKTPSYFITKGIPERVYKMSKKTKLIVVFRDPTTRAISDYAQLVSRNPNVKLFEEMVFLNNRTEIINTSWAIVKIGIYAQHLARWLEYFPIRQIHFVNGENLIENPADEMSRIQEFLGFGQYITADNFTFNRTKGFPCYRKKLSAKRWHCLNSEKGRRHPEIDNSVIKRLQDFYRPFNLKLYRMTGRNFGWS